MSTVKGYTKGISAPSPNAWEDAVSTLSGLLAANLCLEDVKAVLAVNQSLAAGKVTPEQVSGLLQAAAAACLEPTHLVNEVKTLEQSGLSLQAAVGVAALKDTMNGYGLTLNDLPVLVKIAQQHGPVSKVLEAFSVYESLEAIQDEVTAAQEKLENIQAEAAAAGQKLAQIEAKRQELAAPIEAYQKVRELGFTEKALTGLSDAAAGYGGPKVVIEAVKKQIGLEDIKIKLAAAKSELAGLETKISQTMTRHGHLTSAIKMCETLIADYEYGLDALGEIMAAAGKFGEPVAVLKAVSAYGKVVFLEKRAGELAAAAAEREKLLASLETQFKEAQEKLDGLYSVVLKIGDKTGRLEGEFKASENLQKLLDIIKSPEKAAYAEHGQVVMMLGIGLRKWVAANETSFKMPTVIKDGLEALVKDLGGLP